MLLSESQLCPEFSGDGQGRTVDVSYRLACCLDGPYSAGPDTAAQIETVRAEFRIRDELL